MATTGTEIDVSKEALVEWLKSKNEIVGYLGQSYGNPVYNWLRQQVKLHIEEIGGMKWNMGVGIRNTGDGQGNGYYLNYDYSFPHPVFPNQTGQYSGQKLVRLPDEIRDLIGFPRREENPTPSVTQEEALAILGEH